MAIKFKDNTEKVKAKLSSSFKQNLNEATLYIIGRLRRKVSGQRSGREYLVPGTKTIYTSSAPGEPPARRTGDLARSFDYKRSRKWLIVVGNSRDYALTLEKGTQHKAPRPFFRVTFQENETILKNILAKIKQ